MKNHLEEKFLQLSSELKVKNENHFEEFVLLLTKKGKEFDKKFKNISAELNTLKFKNQQQDIYVAQLEMKLSNFVIKNNSSNIQIRNNTEKMLVMTNQQGASSLIPSTRITTAETANPIISIIN